MTDPLAELVERARQLSADERSRLVDLLLESLHEPALREVEVAWGQEIERRLSAYERGEVQTVSAEEAFAEARRLAP